MARPPLPLGTVGKVRFLKTGKSWIARCGFRGLDGVTRPAERSGATKAAAERVLKEAIQDRISHVRDSELGPNSKVWALGQPWPSSTPTAWPSAAFASFAFAIAASWIAAARIERA